MKLILTAAVDNLGVAGDVVEVKDGYGRNFLLPRGYAIAYNRGTAKQIVTLPRGQVAPCDGLILAVGVVAKAEPEQGAEPQGEHERHEQAQTGVHKDSCSSLG